MDLPSQKVAQLGSLHDGLNGVVKRTPQRTERTIDRVDANAVLTRMRVTEACREQASTQRIENPTHIDLLWIHVELEPTLLTANAPQKPGPTKNPKQLRHVSRGQRLAPRNLRNGEKATRLGCDLQQAAQSVFFLGREFHERVRLSILSESRKIDGQDVDGWELLVGVQFLSTGKQQRFALFVLRVRQAALHRTNGLAGFVVMEPNTLGAEIGIDDVNVLALADCLVWAFGLASAAVDAFVGNESSHRGPSINESREKRKVDRKVSV